jgi:hemoglobin-like flavoprotein
MPIEVVGNICVTLAVNGLVTVTEELVYHMDISDLERSLAAIIDMDVFAERFYNRLFTVYPETAYLFKDTDWPKQRRNLMSTIGAVVSGVKSGAYMERAIQNLGQKHTSKGVRPEDYPKIGVCLIATFQSELGMQFTHSMEQSWTEAYTWIAEVMQGGAARVEVTTSTP